MIFLNKKERYQIFGDTMVKNLKKARKCFKKGKYELGHSYLLSAQCCCDEMIKQIDIKRNITTRLKP